MYKEKLLILIKGIAPRYLLVLYIVLVLALGMALSSAVLYPQEVRIRDLENKLRSEQQKVAAVENFILTHPNTEQYLAEMQQSQAKTELLLPGLLDVSKFIAQVEKNARDSGVKLLNVKPAVSVDRAGYREMPVELSVEGSFFGIMAFMKRMEDGERFSLPTAFLIQPKTNSLVARLNLQIFAYGTPPRSAPAPAPAPAPVIPPIVPPVVPATQ